MTRPTPTSTLFPYTTLFRSLVPEVAGVPAGETDLGGPQPHYFRNERSEEHTSELQSHVKLVCRLLLEKKKEFAPGQSIGPSFGPGGILICGGGGCGRRAPSA